MPRRALKTNSVAPNAAATSISDVHAALTATAGGLEAQFSKAGTTLAAVVGSLDHVIADIDSVAGALDQNTAGASVIELKQTADRLAALPEVHAIRAAQMREVGDAARRLGGEVALVTRTLRILDIFGMNIAVASGGDAEFSGFVQNMSDKLAVGENDLSSMTTKIAELTAGIVEMLRVDRQLSAASAQVIPQVPIRLVKEAEALEGHLAACADVAERVAATARRVRDQIGLMLGAMQVGDRARQRLEHIATGLDMVERVRDGLGDAALAHMRRLLVAQLEATAADFDADARVLTSAFAALEPDTRLLLQLMEDQTGAGGTRFLADLEEGIGNVVRLTARLRTADDQAHAVLDLIIGVIADLNMHLDGVRLLRRNVQVIATNIALLCRRHGAAGRGVSAIADEIDVHAAGLPQAAENIAQPIAQLIDVSGAMRAAQNATGTAEAGAALSDAMAVIRKGCQRSAQAVGGSADDGRRLIGMIEGAATELERELNFAQRIRGAATDLAAHVPPAPTGEMSDDDAATVRAFLEELGALYTMAQERDVQAAFLLPGMTHEIVAEAEEDDDGLF